MDCGHGLHEDKLIREAHLATRMQDLASARALLVKLEPLSSPEPSACVSNASIR